MDIRNFAGLRQHARQCVRTERANHRETGTGATCPIALACRRGERRMPSYDSLFNAFVTILVTIDPPGLAPLFLAVTRGMNREERKQVSVRASIIGFGVLALFAVAGASILSVFGITLPAFRVAGGFLLFFIAFEMVFEKRQDRKEKISDVAITRDHIHNIAAFPLAIPLIPGPGPTAAPVLVAG